ncbi:MAG: hypothetical protein A2Y84_01755 [Candidatus Colwellbacteria bacterium RBG_13_48_8]|uniref:Uncharacterized protein n=1 Tax=Candidatus Colwellbacteria bacterium RBG_13_48_8 TaxID=1797685 RepID=A0A1G1YYR8_9BACT|nr:MAG: hypothetical protein A2Y84_01755 [Candidatus Colwellbacteria bacterium RBG_13_48_8]
MEQSSPEQLASQFERLGSEVERRVEGIPQEQREADEHRRALHQVVGERLGKPTPVSSQSSTKSATDLPAELQEKVDRLIEKAVGQDLDRAINEARQVNNAALVDVFHDTLVDELYEKLVQGGKLKSIQK